LTKKEVEQVKAHLNCIRTDCSDCILYEGEGCCEEKFINQILKRLVEKHEAEEKQPEPERFDIGARLDRLESDIQMLKGQNDAQNEINQAVSEQLDEHEELSGNYTVKGDAPLHMGRTGDIVYKVFDDRITYRDKRNNHTTWTFDFIINKGMEILGK